MFDVNLKAELQSSDPGRESSDSGLEPSDSGTGGPTMLSNVQPLELQGSADVLENSELYS